MGKERSLGLRTLTGLVVVLALGACGGGGGGGSPSVSASFASATETLAEDAPATDVVVVLHTSLPALTEDYTVDVVDAASGTATSGSDYAAFAPATLTFLAGSVDGATQVVALDPLDDMLVEAGNETLRLRLQNAVGGGLSGITQVTATLTDIHSAVVGFASGGATLSGETGGAHAVGLELDCGSGVTLGVAVSVRVSDLRTGSAVPPSDYSSFSTQTVTFPSGASDGAVLTVNVNVVDDSTLEPDETIELGLTQLTSAVALGANTLHVLTIQDDDLAGNAAFVPTEGASGTEAGLAYDELVPLGAQAVGAGPNAGTLLRVTNGGGTDMELGAPRLLGTNPNDFAVEIESSTLPAGDPAASAMLVESPAPLVAMPSDGGPGTLLRVDAAGLERLRGLDAVLLSGFELPDLGTVTLDLRRRKLPIADDARLVIDGADVAGGPRTLVGDLQVWSGVVAGMEGSRVFLALGGGSARGFVELPLAQDRFVHFLADGADTVRLVRDPELAALSAATPADFCAGERLVPGQEGVLGMTSGDAPPAAALTVAECRLALETDYQLYDRFDSSVGLTNYVTGLIAAVSEQYFTDVQATFSIAYLGIHTTSNDGWDTQETSGADAGDLLDEFRATWGSTWPAQANLAHFLSGDNLGGGVAYVNVLCSSGFGFGVSGNMTGNIDWSSWTGNSAGFTWDFVVVAHELGHNFGSQHTHSYCPPLDQCYTNCNSATVCTRGTLMSYCHVSCGGMSNIDLEFHPVCANIMRQSINASCLDDAVLTGGDFVQYRVRFNPLTATGARSATLELTHDATNATQPFRVRLSGTAN